MVKPLIAIKLSASNYNGLVNLANRVGDSMSSNLNFLTPSPTLLSLASAVTAVVNSRTQWGDVHNRGSHIDLLDLRAKSLTLHQLLTAMAEYVQNTAQIASGNDYVLMTNIIAGSGFSIKGVNTPQGVLEAVENLRRLSSRSLNPIQAKVKFTKPLNVTSKNNVKSYIIYRGTTNVFTAAVQIDNIAKTEFIDTNNTGAPVTWYYWVVPIGTAGYSAVSTALMISYPAM